MEILRYILMGIFVLLCIVATVLVLLQEGKSQGLGAIAGGSESYWGRNKGRSMEGNPGKMDENSDGCIFRSGNLSESEYFLRY